MLPSKKFVGFLGESQRLVWFYEYLQHQERGLRRRLIEVADQYFMEAKNGGEFTCPNRHCHETFTQKGMWLMHAKYTRHDEEEGFSGQTRYQSITGIPKELIAPLESEQDVLFSNYTH